MSKISQLPQAAAPDGSETVPIIQNGQARQIRYDVLAAAYITAGQAMANYRPTFAQAVNDFAVDTLFTCDEAGPLSIFRRTDADPFYSLLQEVPAAADLSAKLNLTGGNITGNLGIGAPDPEEKLHVEGNIFLGTGPRTIRTGGAGNLNIQVGTGEVAFLRADGASETLRIDGAGNIGIGTSAPGARFNMVGGQAIFASGDGLTVPGIQIKAATVNLLPAAQAQGYIATGDAAIGTAGDMLIAPRTNAAASVRFITGLAPAERMRIDAVGNVGIGSISPQQRLHIHNSAGASYARFTDFTGGSGLEIGVNGGGTAIITQRQNYSLVLSTNNLERIRIAPDGNVGIGTSTPSGNLDIESGASAAAVNVRSTGNDAVVRIISEPGRYSYLAMGDTDDVFRAGLEYLNLNDTLRFWANNAERMRIDASGNLGVGTNNPTQRLDVNGNARLFNTGPCRLTIEADTNNVNENDIAEIFFSQDGGAVTGLIGLNNTNYMVVSSPANCAGLRFNSGGIDHINLAETGIMTRIGQGAFFHHANSAHSSGRITVSTGAPSAGSNGDIWLQVS